VKYWAYFVAKLAVVAVFLRAVWDLMNWLIPEPEPFLHYRVSRYPQDLLWTSALFGLFLLGVGLVYLVVWDQQKRCRTCLRHLRMPLETGSWSKATLLNPPELESICPYGHGSLTEFEVRTTGRKPAEWTPHGDDMWKELESLDRDG
jgi:hypothetical protein